MEGKLIEKSRSYFDYRLRLQVSPDSADHLLLEYIKRNQHLTYSEKEMVLAALRMCWLPLAFQHHLSQADRLTHTDLKRVGLDAILRLKEQIRYVAEITGVDQPADLIVPTYSESNPASSRSPLTHSTAFTNVTVAEDGYEQDLFGD
jgi:hypothetical protein